MPEEKDTQLEFEQDMQRYDLLYIIPATFEEEKINSIKQEVRSRIKDVGGVIISEVEMGRRKFAYPINKQTVGYYDGFEFDLAPNQINIFEKFLKLSDEVVRHLIVKLDPLTDEEIAFHAEIEKKIEARKKKKLQAELAEDAPEIKSVKKTFKKEIKPAEKVIEKSVEVEEVDEAKVAKEKKKEASKATLEDLDKKLDELLDEDVEI